MPSSTAAKGAGPPGRARLRPRLVLDRSSRLASRARRARSLRRRPRPHRARGACEARQMRCVRTICHPRSRGGRRGAERGAPKGPRGEARCRIHPRSTSKPSADPRRAALRPPRGFGGCGGRMIRTHCEPSMPRTAPLTASFTLLLSVAMAGAAKGGAETGTDVHKQEKHEAREAMRTGDFDAPTTAWREGPVRYLLTRDEDLAYRRLETKEARAAYIDHFWESRDPDASTPDNEFRDLFYRRVAFAVRAFTTESTKPGWKTDRGKIYILLGPPDDFDARETRRLDSQIIIWTYRDPPPGTIASPNTQITFLRDPSGEYRLTSVIRLFRSESAMTAALALQALQVKTPPELRPSTDN